MNTTDTLRFTTAGSVDDGKSTLIGRLLYDSKSILEDQIAAIARTTQKRGQDGLDLSLLTDGLTAEREQGITIDVAYRYFATPRRRFIIADTPGHEQYTRNMVTGASTADVAIVLIDASRGILPQSRRHAAVAVLLDMPHVVVAVNKMDLVGYRQEVFQEIKTEFQAVARELGVRELSFIPLSALQGDNVVAKGDHLGWYNGPTLLEFLETVRVARTTSGNFRFPVQMVSRVRFGPQQESRGYLGRVESGKVKPGDAVMVLPSREMAHVAEIITLEDNRDGASAPDSVTLTLDRQVDISRGDFLVDPHHPPRVADQFSATLCWLANEPLSLSRRYLLKHLTRSVRAQIAKVESRLDINTLQADAAVTTLNANDIGQVQIRLAQPLMLDPYWVNHATGSFILIDEATNATVAAGTVQAEASA
ncbi:MAG: GTP-binding protein [Betaproteobacteria bacterium]|nr:GTP-binding protein [Betaproteobacteria bacterium]